MLSSLALSSLLQCCSSAAPPQMCTSSATSAVPRQPHNSRAACRASKGAVLAVDPNGVRAACSPHCCDAVPLRRLRKCAPGRPREELCTTCIALDQPATTASYEKPARGARTGRKDSPLEVVAPRRYRGASRQPSPRAIRERSLATPPVRHPSSAAASAT